MPSLSGPEGGEDVNSNDIKQEIARFESVHPSIYALYDLIEALTDRRQAEMFRRQVASVEDAFVNSQEWTLGHAVPQIKLVGSNLSFKNSSLKGLLGSVNSGKSALVHRYLTGTYLKDESPEGGRFKKEVVLDGMSYLLLIRDEGGAPDEQFSRWIDGAVFVFSLDSEESFRVVCDYFERLDTFREIHDLPIILVGTQDSTSDSNPRVIDDAKARRLANSLNKCPYYETCSTYGLNVERVFQDACVKIVQSRPDLSYLLSVNGPQFQRSQQFQMFQQRAQPPYPMQPPFPLQHIPSNSYRDRMMQPMSQIHSATMGGVDPNLSNCMSTQASLQCMHANTTARGGTYQHRLPPLPMDNVTNGSINTSGSGSALTPQSNDSRRSDMHNNPGFEPDFGDLAQHSTIIGRPSSFTHPFSIEGVAPGTLPRADAPIVLAPLDCLRYPYPPPPPPDMYWGVHPFVIAPPNSSSLTQWYATSNPSFSNLREALGNGRIDCDNDNEWPKLSLAELTSEPRGEAKDPLTPSSTPTQSRKSRPKSNLFVPRLVLQKKTDDAREKEKKVVDGIGSGRSIPIKQGYLYKRTCKPLNKEWKTKKYVALTDDARLIYHPSIQDYVQNSHGKEIDLSRVTVKIPGVTFRQTGGQVSSNGPARNQLTEMASGMLYKLSASLENPSGSAVIDQAQVSNDNVNAGNRMASQQGPKDTSKKRYRRVKSSQKAGTTDGYESEGYEFQLISMDRQWNFEAHSLEDRDDWVSHIDQAIITRLQLLESTSKREAILTGSASGVAPPSHAGVEVPSNSWGGGSHSGPGVGAGGGGGGSGTTGSDPGGVTKEGEKGENMRVDEAMAKSLRAVAGNDACADCGAPDPDWASLNLGEMVCIECSGVHRKLGTHISRIRSLMLDDWTPEAAAVMRAIGNTLANSVWEAAVPGNAASRRKPDSRSSKEEMEAWIRAKYEHREFLPPLPYPEAPLQQQLIDAIARQDTRQVILCLARATPDTVNAPYSRQDPRAAIHIAATLGNIVYLQLLLWYNGDPGVVDSEGRNAFYYAHCSYHFDCANFLARNGCPRQAVPTPALSHFATVQQQPQQHHHQQQQQQVKSPPPPSQSQGANSITPKHHPQQHAAYQQQQQQQALSYRSSGVAVSPGMPPPTPQGVMTGGFAPVFMHNIMPVSSANALHGTMGGSSSGLGPATVVAGATLPRRRGPFGPGQSCYLPAQPPPAAVANSMANRPLPVAGAFDPNTGRPLVPSSSMPVPASSKPGDNSSQEIGI
ncbi:unnamed protein product [Hydatigera taeniaeformis]|uniref:Centaurin-gamma-1A n=1 Tax=Hydatigena taeniaeformis TaxID=6205 RepID=A0A0R3X164_HYDTA|nr:unnamed protein product [Hydatigera taeniaeformis]